MSLYVKQLCFTHMDPVVKKNKLALTWSLYLAETSLEANISNYLTSHNGVGFGTSFYYNNIELSYMYMSEYRMRDIKNKLI